MNTATPYLDRILDPVTECFTPQFARRLVDLRADPQTQRRLDELADRANDGALTPQEDAEYKELIDAMDLLSILQAKARTFLRQHSDVQ